VAFGRAGTKPIYLIKFILNVTQMTQKEFIEVVVLNQIGDVVKLHPYLSFPLIATAIELLGGCIDKSKRGFNAGGGSEKRFNDAIVSLFPTRYHRFTDKSISNIDLYKGLRCGMNHLFLPNTGIALTESKSRNAHLSVRNGQLLLVAEELYKDLQNAGREVINKLGSAEISEKFGLAV
jgi:hypothetical protein